MCIRDRIRPDDSYPPDGTYWADLNIFRRIKFVSSYDAKEAKRELGSIWEMTKKDPLSPVSYLSLIHISEPTKRRGTSYAVFCLKKKKKNSTEDRLYP